MEDDNQKEITVIPTVMPDSEEDFLEKIEFVYRYVKTIQIDVMDGNFVESVSWPYNDGGNIFWQNLCDQESGLPHWDKVDYEIDLMVNDQIGEARNWINAGVSRIIGHVEAFESEELIKEFIELGRDSMVEVYMALAPSTDLGRVKKWIKSDQEKAEAGPDEFFIDGVQFMGIEKVGFQGQPFAEEILDKISELRSEFPNLPISVDGGVNDETSQKLIEAGANSLASGSFIFESDDPKEAINTLLGNSV